MANLYDAVVIGGGPAGLTAALYLARARYRVVVVEKESFGGQITITQTVANYPGAPNISGRELTTIMRQQAESFGAEFMLAEVESLALEGDIKHIQTTRGELQAFGVIVATGANPRMIGFKGEEEFRGRGVGYCATCDGQFFTDLDVFVVGGGFAAAEEAVFLTQYARKVTVLVRGDAFSCKGSIAEEALAHPGIEVLFNTEMLEIGGEGKLAYAVYKNTATGAETRYTPPSGETFGVFVFAGYSPATALVQNTLELDAQGYIVTNTLRETAIAGVYAAGDVCQKRLRQLVTATGDGATAANELERYAEKMRAKTGLIPELPKPSAKAANASAQETSAAATQGDNEDGFFTPEIRQQLQGVFNKMQHPLQLRVTLDNQPVSEEVKAFVTGLCEQTDLLSYEFVQADDNTLNAPAIQILRENAEDTGLSFHGVPGGHEFSSFVLGLYNAAGPGQPIDEETAAAITSLPKPVNAKILISLSCTMCPELVIAAQHIAALNPHVRADVYDINHFPQLKEQYQAMSVPCLVLNNDTVSFGKKNIKQLLALYQGL